MSSTNSGNTGQPTEDVGYGEELTPDDIRWQAAAAELTPDKTVTRINTNARATVTTVALVGSLLTALGLISAQSLLGDTLTRWLALAAVGVSLSAVVTALLYLALRLEQMNLHDVGDVKRWYARQFHRAYLVVAASWLLVVAVLLGAAAAAITILQAGPGDDPVMSLSVVGSGAARSVQVQVSVSALEAGSEVTVQVFGLAGDCPEIVLLDSRSRADRTGKVAITSTIESVTCYQRFRLDVRGNDVQDSLTVP